MASDWLRYFRLLLCNNLTVFNKSTERPLPSLYFFLGGVNRKTKMAALASDLLRHFWLLCNYWTELNGTWQGTRSQHLPRLCFLGRSESKDGHPGLWLAETLWLLTWDRWREFYENFQVHVASTQCPLTILCFRVNQKEKITTWGDPSRWLIVLKCTICGPFGPFVFKMRLPGCPVASPGSGCPTFHVQLGSPSSSPFVLPSVSESALHSSVVHVCLCNRKAFQRKRNMFLISSQYYSLIQFRFCVQNSEFRALIIKEKI